MQRLAALLATSTLLLPVLALIPQPAAAAASDYTHGVEDFERFNNLDRPTSSHYTFTSATTGMASVVTDPLGTHGKVFSSTSTSAQAFQTTGPVVWAGGSGTNGGGMTMALHGPAGTAIELRSYAANPTTDDIAFSISITNTNTITYNFIYWNGPGSSTSYSTAISPTSVDPTAAWISVGVAGPMVGTQSAGCVPSCTALTCPGTCSYIGSDYTSGKASTKAIAVSFTPKDMGYFTFTSGSSTPAYLDDVAFGVPAITYPTPDASYTLTGTFGGWAMDKLSRGLVVRTTSPSPSTIYSLDPIDLTTVRGTDGNGCNRADGVMVYSSVQGGGIYVGQADCVDGTSAEVDHFKITNERMSDPDIGNTLCEDNDFCSFDMTGEESNTHCSGEDNGIPVNSLQIGDLESTPISFRHGAHSVNNLGINYDRVQVGFVYSNAANGYIGAWAYSHQDNDEDQICHNELPFSVPGGTAQICTWRSKGTTNDYMGAVSSSSDTRVLRVDVADPATQYAPYVTLTNIPVAPGRAIGIDCAENSRAVLMGTDGTVKVLNLIGSASSSTPVLQKAGYAYSRGVAITLNGKWAAYATGATAVQIACVADCEDNVTAGTVVARITLPSGTYKGMYFDGQRLWVATTTKVARYDVLAATHAGTPGTQINPITGDTECLRDDGSYGSCDGIIDPGTANAGHGLPGLDKDELGDALGIGTDAAGWLIATLLIAAITFIFYMMKPALGILGGVVGLGLATALGYAPIWLTAFLALVGIVVVVFHFKGSGSGA